MDNIKIVVKNRYNEIMSGDFFVSRRLQYE